MDNKRRKQYEDIECVPTGYANGTAPGIPFTDREKEKMVEQATIMNEIMITHSYIAPAPKCPNLNCPFHDRCFPNSSKLNQNVTETSNQNSAQLP